MLQPGAEETTALIYLATFSVGFVIGATIVLGILLLVIGGRR